MFDALISKSRSALKLRSFFFRSFYFSLILSVCFPVKGWSQSSDFPAGTGSVNDFSTMAFSRPMTGALQSEKREFFVGNSFFRDPWVVAPASTMGRDGLGPTFNAVSCSSCHQMDGRGIGYRKDKVDISLLFRLSHVSPERTLVPDPWYGSQINPFGIPGVSGEGTVGVRFEITDGQYPDGTKYQLRRPVFDFSKLSFGALDPRTRTSARVAPQVIGLGLLENIPETEILKLEDPQDSNQDGISGRANWAVDLETGQKKIGRFGWKASEPTLKQQNAAAFLGDMGLTTSMFDQENCTPLQAECLKAPHGGQPEVSDLILDRVTAYMQLVSVPERRQKLVGQSANTKGAETNSAETTGQVDSSEIQQGEKLFAQIQCAACHTPSFKTGSQSKFAILNEQLIWPYSDLLLHDLGMDLADHRPDKMANGREWRTQPLWGIGLFMTVNGHSNLLHDGRARSVEEAILWHGGEAESSKQSFMGLTAPNRALLIKFVENL